ncbi:MAG: tRNA lysidine(34) synthetase TilS [Verrucomicrobiota bacterium]|nr:tRNA lysidine(34) synthetase TilS [Verrucomicrobiota bacterium]MDP7049866.1 tRNA lysidine(34) synthetase TilS [Verrucomicrobiota bacterium]
MHPLAERVGDIIRVQHFFPGGGGIVVAVSGGIDSMVLLNLLATPALGLRDRLIVAHFDHQLRSTESEADAALVSQAAERLGLPFESGSDNTRQLAAETGVGIEAAARQLRHGFFARLAKRLDAVIALAHHAGDQVETFFLRLLRGAGDRGLSGMKAVARSPADPCVTLVRPLLGICRDEITAFAIGEGIAYREDATNTDTRFIRNRIRHELLPRLAEQFGASVSRQVLKAMQLAGDAADCIDHLAADWSGEPPFGQLPVAVQRQVVQQQLFALGDEPSFDLVETLRLEAGRVIEVAPGRRLQRNADGRLEAAAAEPEFLLAECDVSLEGQADEIEFAGLKIRWERLAGGLAEWRDLAQAKNCEVFDSESLGRAITLRHWRPGDRYQPIGQVGTTKLQDLFVNQKIPKAKRRQLVVAEAADGRLLWVQQLRIADGGKVTQSTRELLLFNW